MSKKTTLFAITMLAAMPMAFVQAKPIKAEEVVTTQVTATETETRKAELEANKAERTELMVQRKDALAQKKCETAQKRISTKIGQLENNRQMYQRVYGNMDSRLTRLVARLDSAGLDTTKLKTELATLKTMTQKLYSDYDAFITSFKGTETAACEKTREEFKSQFEGVRAQVALIKNDRSAIKNFFNSNVKTELQALKAQLGEEVVIEETIEVEEEKTTKDVRVKKEKSSSESESESETVTETQTSVQN